MGDLASPLDIRAHHLLCILGFRGLGYSQEFVAKMGKVVEELTSNSTFPITIIAGCDAICRSCPHNKNDRCRKKADSEERVRAKDLAVLERLGLEAGTQITPAEVWGRVKESFSANEIRKICRKCQWLELGYCVEGLEKLQAG
ncbi:MAG: DUF1284 domain-containing protein [Dehalococcoidales bacterium]|nr:DUF1284 domain-containing protein [Dehalococcoidales bacterium]